MTRERRSDDDRPRKVCPSCESVQVRPRATSIGAQPRQGDGDYYCAQCGTDFDDPDEAVVEREAPPTHSLAWELHNRDQLGGDT